MRLAGMDRISRALAVVVSVCALGVTGGCSQLVTQLFPSDPLAPIVVAHTSSGFELISVCGSSIASASVGQSTENASANAYSWEAEAVGTPTPRLVLFADRIDGYRISVAGARDLTAEAVVVVYTADDIAGSLHMDLDRLAIGQVAYQNGIVSSAEFDQLSKTAFGCRP